MEVQVSQLWSCFDKESAMRTGTTRGRITPYVLQQPPSLPETLEPDISRCELPARSWDRLAEHDATLLVTALEDLQAQRLAIEWLLNADVLRLCLV
jgi:hypothetical protein